MLGNLRLVGYSAIMMDSMNGLPSKCPADALIGSPCRLSTSFQMVSSILSTLLGWASKSNLATLLLASSSIISRRVLILVGLGYLLLLCISLTWPLNLSKTLPLYFGRSLPQEFCSSDCTSSSTASSFGLASSWDGFLNLSLVRDVFLTSHGLVHCL